MCGFIRWTYTSASNYYSTFVLLPPFNLPNVQQPTKKKLMDLDGRYNVLYWAKFFFTPFSSSFKYFQPSNGLYCPTFSRFPVWEDATTTLLISFLYLLHTSPSLPLIPYSIGMFKSGRDPFFQQVNCSLPIHHPFPSISIYIGILLIQIGTPLLFG